MRRVRAFVVAVISVVACSSSSRPATDAAVDAAIDAPIDAPADPCLSCRLDQICVARYNGTCGESVGCVARTVDCAVGTCSPACEMAYCPQPYQCRNRPPCGGESPHAFTCYGP